MCKAVIIGKKWGPGRPSSFTLIELLVVMSIIIILASITLWAAQALWTKAARSRATAEIQGISSALEGYKTDNGIYPPSTNLLGGTTANYPVSPLGSAANGYQASAQILYEALSGKTNFTDTTLYTRAYYPNFRINQLGNYTAASGTGFALATSTYVQDPWTYPYGYSTGDGLSPSVSYPANGSNFFDLWSTAGSISTYVGSSTTTYSTNAWVSNWQSQ